MSLSRINLYEPHTLDQALKALADSEENRILAGGTDLLVDYKEGLTEAKHLISLQKIQELKGIEEKNGKIRIGAMVTPKEIASHALVQRHLPALVEAACSMASNQIRSMATIGGNIASAVPSADLPPVLIAAEAEIRLVCLQDRRIVPLLEFFTGPRMTVCRDEEILTDILFPVPEPNTGLSYKKVKLREANALAVASVAARITLMDDRIDEASVVLGAVGPAPILVLEASGILKGKKPSSGLFKKASAIAKEKSRPITDVRGSIWYRKELIKTLAQRALKEASVRAGEDRKG
ncbi:MAG: xanthine dehydrogenase family protein subunit M [Candidatus Aminicenantes bacterium]|jgi:carbon-monoxide dehydrogenase medium subunit